MTPEQRFRYTLNNYVATVQMRDEAEMADDFEEAESYDQDIENYYQELIKFTTFYASRFSI